MISELTQLANALPQTGTDLRHTSHGVVKADQIAFTQQAGTIIAPHTSLSQAFHAKLNSDEESRKNSKQDMTNAQQPPDNSRSGIKPDNSIAHIAGHVAPAKTRHLASTDPFQHKASGSVVDSQVRRHAPWGRVRLPSHLDGRKAANDAIPAPSPARSRPLIGRPVSDDVADPRPPSGEQARVTDGLTGSVTNSPASHAPPERDASTDGEADALQADTSETGTSVRPKHQGPRNSATMFEYNKTNANSVKLDTTGREVENPTADVAADQSDGHKTAEAEPFAAFPAGPGITIGRTLNDGPGTRESTPEDENYWSDNATLQRETVRIGDTSPLSETARPKTSALNMTAKRDKNGAAKREVYYPTSISALPRGDRPGGLPDHHRGNVTGAETVDQLREVISEQVPGGLESRTAGTVPHGRADVALPQPETAAADDTSAADDTAAADEGHVENGPPHVKHLEIYTTHEVPLTSQTESNSEKGTLDRKQPESYNEHGVRPTSEPETQVENELSFTIQPEILTKDGASSSSQHKTQDAKDDLNAEIEMHVVTEKHSEDHQPYPEDGLEIRPVDRYRYGPPRVAISSDPLPARYGAPLSVLRSQVHGEPEDRYRPPLPGQPSGHHESPHHISPPGSPHSPHSSPVVGLHQGSVSGPYRSLHGSPHWDPDAGPVVGHTPQNSRRRPGHPGELSYPVIRPIPRPPMSPYVPHVQESDNPLEDHDRPPADPNRPLHLVTRSTPEPDSERPSAASGITHEVDGQSEELYRLHSLRRHPASENGETNTESHHPTSSYGPPKSAENHQGSLYHPPKSPQTNVKTETDKEENIRSPQKLALYGDYKPVYINVNHYIVPPMNEHHSPKSNSIHSLHVTDYIKLNSQQKPPHTSTLHQAAPFYSYIPRNEQGDHQNLGNDVPIETSITYNSRNKPLPVPRIRNYVVSSLTKNKRRSLHEEQPETPTKSHPRRSLHLLPLPDFPLISQTSSSPSSQSIPDLSSPHIAPLPSQHSSPSSSSQPTTSASSSTPSSIAATDQTASNIMELLQRVNSSTLIHLLKMTELDTLLADTG